MVNSGLNILKDETIVNKIYFNSYITNIIGNNKNKVSVRLALPIIFITLYSNPVYAYLDPGSGSAIIGVITATIGSLWYSIKSIYYRLTGKKRINAFIANEHGNENESLVLFSEGKAYWGTFRPLVEALIRQKIPFRYRTLDLYDPALMIESPYMNSKRLSNTAIGLTELSKIKASVMVATTPNIGTKNYPLKRSPNVRNLVHVFHHVGDISTYKKYSLDQYDTVILAGEFQTKSIRDIENTRSLKPKVLKPLGLPYLDALYQELPCAKHNDDEIITVLVGSSWGAKGCLKRYGTDFIHNLLTAGFAVIVRPHPQSYKTEPEFIEQCKKELSEHVLVTWDDEISPNGAMNKSQLLISDTSSLRFDYAFLYEKPIITLEISKGDLNGFEADDLDVLWNDSAGAKIGKTVNSQSIKDLPEIVSQVVKNYSASDITAFRDETVINFGNSATEIAIYLSELQSNSYHKYSMELTKSCK